MTSDIHVSAVVPQLLASDTVLYNGQPVAIVLAGRWTAPTPTFTLPAVNRDTFTLTRLPYTYNYYKS